MLSYQHEFHAANHADIIKHICLNYILKSLCKKEKPFTLIDSHAGAALFDLKDPRALKTNEATGGIKKLLLYSQKNFPLPQIIEDYLEAEKPFLNKELYAGSAMLEKLSLRKGDKLFAIEKHPQAFNLLKENMKNAISPVCVLEQDSYQALEALTPPQIKRGLVLTDPSYEDESDYKKVSDTLSLVHKKWNTAIIALWYPLLTTKQNLLAQMLTNLEYSAKLGLNPCESLRIELKIKSPLLLEEENNSNALHKGHMYGSGMFIINPPYLLKEKLEEALPYLTDALKE